MFLKVISNFIYIWIYKVCFWIYKVCLILGLTSVPSLSTLEGVRKYISEMGNSPSAIAPKQTVMLDWVSKEDGTHLLTITVGNKVHCRPQVAFFPFFQVISQFFITGISSNTPLIQRIYKI